MSIKKENNDKKELNPKGCQNKKLYFNKNEKSFGAQIEQQREFSFGI